MGLLGGSQVCNGSGRPLAQGGLCVRSGWRHWAARPQVDRPRRGCYPHSLAGRLARPGWRSGCGVSCARGDMMGLWWERSSVLFISPRAESPSWGSSRPPSSPPASSSARSRGSTVRLGGRLKVPRRRGGSGAAAGGAGSGLVTAATGASHAVAVLREQSSGCAATWLILTRCKRRM